MNKLKAVDKAFNFYENSFNLIISLLVFSLSTLFYWLNHFNIGNGEGISVYLVDKIIFPREGILVTVAAMFIGIYFTVYSILGTVKVDSTLANIPKKKFFKLLKFIQIGFIVAFLYLVFSIFYPWLSENLNGYPKQVLYLFFIILFLNLFLSALRVALALYVTFKKDFNNLHESVEKEKQEKNKQIIMMARLDEFLNRQDEIEAVAKARKLNEVLELKNPKK